MSSPNRRGMRRAAPLPKLWEVRQPTPYELQRAEDLVRGYRLEPAKRRLMHYAVTADGRRVTARSNRALPAVLSSLDTKAGAPIVELRVEGSPEIVCVADVPRMDAWAPTPTERHLAVIAQAAGDQEAGTFVRLDDGTMLLDGQRVDAGPRLSQRAMAYLALLDQRKSSRSAMIDTAFSLRIFIELVGDKAVGEVTHDDCDLFVRALGVWPANASKKIQYRGLAAPDVVRAARARKAPPLHLHTQQKHVNRLRCFFMFLENRREIEPGFLFGVRLYNRRRMAPEARLSFTPEMLTTIFQRLHSEPLKSPYRYWAPILGLYHGLRINEIGQLYLDDVFERHGRWYLRITDQGPAQRLKNTYSRRVLPLRQEVIDCGFVEFIEQAKRWGRVTLFPDVVWGPNGPGDTISRWFNTRFLRKICGITDKRYTFHSLRHTFINAAHDSNVKKTDIARLIGHTVGTDILTLHYFGRDDRPEALVSVLDTIEFPPVTHGRYDAAAYDWVFQRSKLEAERNQDIDRRLSHHTPLTPTLAR